MTKSPALKKANTKWEKEVYFKTLLRIRKDARPEETIRAAADQMTGGSLNGYITRAIKNQLILDGFGDDLPAGSTEGNEENKTD